MLKNRENILDSKNKEVEKKFQFQETTWKIYGCFHNYFNFGRVKNIRFTLSFFIKQTSQVEKKFVSYFLKSSRAITVMDFVEYE